MSTTDVHSTDASELAGVEKVDLKMEVVVIPVSDVDRAKELYGGLGWRLDADVAPSEDFRLIQLTPSGSGCSIAPDRRSYSSFVSFSDPDGNGWLVQEVTTRLPGGVEQGETRPS